MRNIGTDTQIADLDHHSRQEDLINMELYKSSFPPGPLVIGLFLLFEYTKLKPYQLDLNTDRVVVIKIYIFFAPSPSKHNI